MLCVHGMSAGSVGVSIHTPKKMTYFVGWVERIFAKPINLQGIDGFHYMPKSRYFILPILRKLICQKKIVIPAGS